MKLIIGIFFKGLFAILPVAISIFLIVKVANFLETLFDDMLFTNLPGLKEIPGLSILLALLFIFFVGLILSSKTVTSTFHWFELPFREVPILKNIYSAVKDLTQFFDKKAEKAGKVVLVTFPDSTIKAMGLLTKDDLTKLPFEDVGQFVAVYFPLSYQLGGFTALIPRTWVKEVDMKVDQAMKLALTGWMNYP